MPNDMRDRKNHYMCCGNCEHFKKGVCYDFCNLKHIKIRRFRIRALFCTKYIDNRSDTE